MGPKLEQAVTRNKKLRRYGKSLPRDERKTMTIMRQMDEIEHTKKAVKAAAPRLERSTGANERVGAKHRLSDASDDEWSGGEATQELRGMVTHEGHKKNGMVNGMSKECTQEGCQKIPNDEKRITLRERGER